MTTEKYWEPYAGGELISKETLEQVGGVSKQNPEVEKVTNNRQVGGDHYQKSIQPWDLIAVWDLNFFEGNVVKYVTRWKKTNKLEDLHKAQHYLKKLIELNSPK